MENNEEFSPDDSSSDKLNEVTIDDVFEPPSTSTSAEQGAKPKAKKIPVALTQLPMEQLLKKSFSTYTPQERMRVANRNKIMNSARQITDFNISDMGGPYLHQDKHYAGDLHQTFAGELHYWCCKCQVYSGTTPCCPSMEQLCPVGREMDQNVVLTRSQTYRTLAG